jgi:DNA-binding NarL/FixJ family response regulator
MLGDEQFCIMRAAGLGGADATKLTEILTARELQIASLVALGRLNKQIAAQLHISEWTVATHVRRVFCKLGVSTRGHGLPLRIPDQQAAGPRRVTAPRRAAARVAADRAEATRSVPSWSSSDRELFTKN